MNTLEFVQRYQFPHPTVGDEGPEVFIHGDAEAVRTSLPGSVYIELLKMTFMSTTVYGGNAHLDQFEIAAVAVYRV